ncbi:MAG: hypothetical protein WC770_09200 [Phycisphaerae bacterium]|jgi:hypothetical protein
MAKTKTSVPEKSKTTAKRFATRYGQHYSIVMLPTVTEVINGIAITRPGKTIEFKNGIYETKDSQEQEFLENSSFAGIDYQEVTKEVTSALVTKSLAERESELKAKEEDLKRREMEIKGREEGSESSVGTEARTKEKSKSKQAKF